MGNLDNEKISNSLNLRSLRNLLIFNKNKKRAIYLLKKLFPSRFGNYRKDLKFQPLDQEDISRRVNNLKKILKLDENINSTVLSDRTILIKRN